MTAAILFLLSIMRTLGRSTVRADGLSLPLEASEGTVVAVAVTGASNRPAFLGNLVGRCKACKRGHCAPDAVRSQLTVHAPKYHRRPQVWDGAISGDRLFVMGPSGAYLADCPCGQRVGLHAVVGKFSPVHECNAKCLNATGPACECSCKGRNHGRGN